MILRKAKFCLLLLTCESTVRAFTTNSVSTTRGSTYEPTQLSSAETLAADTINGKSPSLNIRLNNYEKARTVTSVCTSGTLCTTSSHDGIEGAPFGSFVDYVLDDDGNPVLLMNSMSMHTINIQENGNMVTLFTQLTPQASGGNQDVSRCSLTGLLEPIDPSEEGMDAIRMRYSLTHVYADQVMDSPKFAFYRLTPKQIYYVGGFGVNTQWVDPADYGAAQPDILAAYSREMTVNLNANHASDLELTAKELLKAGDVTKVKVTSVDRLGMDVRVTCNQGTRRNKLVTDEYRIGFRIPVQSVEDAKSEILKIFQEAWERANNVWGDDESDELIGDDVPVMKIAADDLE